MYSAWSTLYLTWIRTHSRCMYSQNRLNRNRIPYSFPRSAYSPCKTPTLALAPTCSCVPPSEQHHTLLHAHSLPRLLAFTRYCSTSKLYCGSLSSFYCFPQPATPTLSQYYRTTVAQYTPPYRPPRFMSYTTRYWISCKGQLGYNPKVLAAQVDLEQQHYFLFLSLRTYNSHHNSRAQSRETVPAPRR